MPLRTILQWSRASRPQVASRFASRRAGLQQPGGADQRGERAAADVVQHLPHQRRRPGPHARLAERLRGSHERLRAGRADGRDERR